jgi:hypothetical protein
VDKRGHAQGDGSEDMCVLVREGEGKKEGAEEGWVDKQGDSQGDSCEDMCVTRKGGRGELKWRGSG